MLENLSEYKILLASNSPRRQELLRSMGINFEVAVRKGIEESYPPELRAKSVPEYLAVQKAQAYADMLEDPKNLLITADTVVICNKQILGKPATTDEAREMLRTLQNNSHRVVTGVALTSRAKQVAFSVKTKVLMRPLSQELIDYYVDNYKPLDKAGAYGIQEWIGLVGIDHIEGSYHNVMGLPTQRLFQELANF